MVDESQALERYHLHLCMQISRQKVERRQEENCHYQVAAQSAQTTGLHIDSPKIQHILISLHVQSYPPDEHNPICGETKDLES
jgi:hypothetical protein